MLGVLIFDSVVPFIAFTVLYLGINAISVPVLQALRSALRQRQPVLRLPEYLSPVLPVLRHRILCRTCLYFRSRIRDISMYFSQSLSFLLIPPSIH
jgi:hypothetical protein